MVHTVLKKFKGLEYINKACKNEHSLLLTVWSYQPVQESAPRQYNLILKANVSDIELGISIINFLANGRARMIQRWTSSETAHF